MLCRESKEESPESRRLFGAVWGAQPQRSPRGKHFKANVVTQKRTKAAPPSPFSASFVLRRDRRKETHKPEVNQISSITAQSHENVLMAIPTEYEGTQRRGERGWRRGLCAFLRNHIGFEMLSAGSPLGAARPQACAKESSTLWTLFI